MTLESGVSKHVMINHVGSETQGISCGPGQISMLSQPAPHKSINEDCAAAFELSDTQCVLAVADGVGGAPLGHEASRLAIEAIEECLQDTRPGEALRSRITDAFELAHQRIMMLDVGAATTFIVADISDGVLRTYHVGDSGCLVCGQRGKLKIKTLLHSPSAYLEKAGLITEQESLTHPQRHFVTNLVGIEDMTIDVGEPIKLAQNDTLLLGSDGVFDNANTADLIDTIRIGPLKKSGEQLKAQMLTAMTGGDSSLPGKPDDLSFIVYRTNKPGA